MKRVAGIFILFTVVLIFSSCQKKKKLLVGCWSKLENYGQQQISNSYQFNDDNTWIYYTRTGPFGAQSGCFEGTYKLRGSKLILKYENCEPSVTKYKIKKLTEDEMIWEGSFTLYKCD